MSSSYIGRVPEVGNYRKADSISVVNGQATYNLTVNSNAVNPNANQVICSLNGVIQSSNDSFTIASNQITFASNLVTGDVIDFILILGDTLDIGTPSDNTVGITQLNVSDGSNGQALTTNGSGTLAFADAGLSGWSSNSNNLLPSDASKGIYLGVNSATSSNLLNDYEEGEFANALSIDGTTQTNYSSGRSHLKYVKIGSLVHCSGLIDTDGQTLQDTGQIYVRLPFAVASSGSNSYNASKAFSDVMGGGSTHPGYFYVQENDTICEFDTIDTSGSTAVDGSGLSVSSTSHRVFMFLDITYQTDA